MMIALLPRLFCSVGDDRCYCYRLSWCCCRRTTQQRSHRWCCWRVRHARPRRRRFLSLLLLRLVLPEHFRACELQIVMPRHLWSNDHPIMIALLTRWTCATLRTGCKLMLLIPRVGRPHCRSCVADCVGDDARSSAGGDLCFRFCCCF